MVGGNISTLPESSKRKVRKGTHSCWECRRRKTRCQFGSQSDTVCIGCRSRGSACVSQEYSEDANRDTPDRRLAQRLNRLESLMEKLVDKMGPPNSAAHVAASVPPRSSRTNPSSDASGSPVLAASTPITTASSSEMSRVERAASQINLVTAPHESCSKKSAIGRWQESLPDPLPRPTAFSLPPTRVGSPPLSGEPLRAISKAIYPLFPSQEACNTVFNASPGNLMVVHSHGSLEDIGTLAKERLAAAALIPKETEHPVVIANHLVQLAICLQHLPPTFDARGLQLGKAPGDLAREIASTTWSLIGTNDELMSSVDGLRFLQFHAFYNKNAGNLRKSWLCCRKALSFAQLIGLDRATKSTPPNTVKSSPDAKAPEDLEYMYFRILGSDCMLSLMLGLPVGTHDNNYVRPSLLAGLSNMEKMDRLSIYIASCIIDRNRSSPDDAYSMTLRIHNDLEDVRKMMGPDWFVMPRQEDLASGNMNTEVTTWAALMFQLQVNSLSIFLHLPYLLRDASEKQWGSSKRICMTASREVLYRFVHFRSINNTAFCFRYVDYSALIGAMTLILGYLGRRPPSGNSAIERALTQQCAEDRQLILTTVEKMQEVSTLNEDKLTLESSEIVLQLLPIMDTWRTLSTTTREAVDKYLRLTVPYLGTININTSVAECDQQPPQHTPGGPHHATNLAQTAPTAGLAPSVDFSTETTPSDPFDVMSMPLSIPGLTPESLPTDSPAPGFPSSYLTIDPDLSAMDSMMAIDFDGGEDLDIPAEWADFGQPNTMQPGLAADSSDWLLQGVDTTFWSVLNGGFVRYD